MKMLRKILVLLLVVTMMVSVIPTANAATMNIGKITDAYIGTTWFKWYTQYAGYPGINFDTGDYFTQTISYMTLNDGRIAYCVEPHVTATTGAHSSVSWDQLDDFKQNGITLALAYGAPNNGKTSAAAYYGTQAVVWDMACGYRDFNGNFMYADGAGYLTSSPFAQALAQYQPAALAEYNAILANIAKHGTIPSFASKSKYQNLKTITLKYNSSSGKYEASVTDTNSVLANFNFISSVSGLTFSKSGNTLKISATPAAAANLESAVTIRNRGNEVEVSSDLCTLWRPASGQMLCTLDVATDPVPCYFKLKAEVRGAIKITKGTNTGENLEGWEFIVKKADGTTVGTYTTGADGTVTVQNLDEGTYTVQEVGKEDTYWTCDTEEKTVVVTTGTTSEVKVTNTHYGDLLIKKEVPEGGVLEGWQFKVTRLSDNADMGTFTSGADGTINTGNLLPGQYQVEEIIDDTSLYYCEENPITITVTGGQTATVTFSNQLRMGQITVLKTGEALSSVTEADGIYTPVYSVQNLPGAVFEIRAAENIIAPDGSTIYNAGDLVDTITTDSTGSATSKQIHLGRYSVIETVAPDGMTVYPVPQTVTLTYENDGATVVVEDVSVQNQRQKVSISMSKALEEAPEYGITPGSEITSVQFGLYAAEDIIAADGSKIPEDGLLEKVSCDVNGSIKFTADVPFGASLYVKEIATDEKYVLSPEEIPVPMPAKNQDIVKVEININNGEAVVNELIRGSVQGIKKDEEGNALEGATFGLFAANETTFTEEKAIKTSVSAADGTFGFEDVPFGEYLVREIEAPEGFVLDKTTHKIEISEDEQVIEVSAVNEFIIGTVTTTKVDADYPENKLTGATFEIYLDADGNEEYTAGTDTLVGEMTEAEFGMYKMEDLRYGGYFLYEKTAPANFLRDETYHYFEIRTDSEVVEVENEAGVGFINEPNRGTILGKKIDEDGFTICGATFGLFAASETEFTVENAIATSVSNEIGVFGFENIRFGSYIVKEIKAAPAFVLNDETFEVAITENEQIIEITVENKFLTGSVTTTKVDADYPENKLSGAIFEVYVDSDGDKAFDEGSDLLVGELTEVEVGIYELNGLRYNGYFLYESKAPENFRQDETYHYFEIETNDQVVTVENKAGVGFINEAQTGSLELTKKDISTGALLPNAGFKIRNEAGEVVAEGVTDKNGVATFELRVGSYTYQEYSAPEGYQIDNREFPFEIKEDGQIVKAEMTNTPIPKTPSTGDTFNITLIVALMVVSAAALLLILFVTGKNKTGKFSKK